MTSERINEMLDAISANEEASKKFDQLLEMKLNGFSDKWSVDDITEAVFNKFCK